MRGHVEEPKTSIEKMTTKKVVVRNMPLCADDCPKCIHIATATAPRNPANHLHTKTTQFRWTPLAYHLFTYLCGGGRGGAGRGEQLAPNRSAHLVPHFLSAGIVLPDNNSGARNLL